MKKNKWRYKTRDRYDGMLYRCYNPKASSYKHYGGRGIYVCDRWLGPDGMLHFFEDMGDPPLKRSLDRIDNNGPYSPENCRWATCPQQCRNKRSNTIVEVDGEKMCLVEALEKDGIKKGTYKARIKSGASPEEALSPSYIEDKRRRKATDILVEDNFILLGDERVLLIDALEKIGMRKSTYNDRIKKGMTPEQALTLPYGTYISVIKKGKENKEKTWEDTHHTYMKWVE